MNALQKARKKVNELEFGTEEWESAMQEVRALVEQENNATDFGQHNCESDGKWYA